MTLSGDSLVLLLLFVACIAFVLACVWLVRR